MVELVTIDLILTGCVWCLHHSHWFCLWLLGFNDLLGDLAALVAALVLPLSLVACQYRTVAMTSTDTTLSTSRLIMRIKMR